MLVELGIIVKDHFDVGVEPRSDTCKLPVHQRSCQRAASLHLEHLCTSYVDSESTAVSVVFYRRRASVREHDDQVLLSRDPPRLPSLR